MRYTTFVMYSNKQTAMQAATSINPAFVTGFLAARNIELPGEPILGTNKAGKYKGLTAEAFAKELRNGGTCWSFRLEPIA